MGLYDHAFLGERQLAKTIRKVRPPVLFVKAHQVMVCPFAMGRAFGFAAATQTPEIRT
jgi:hypothetical protein